MACKHSASTSAGRQAQVKVRLPETLRRSLEIEARDRGHSMNTEIVRRLRESLLAQDQTPTLIAKALLSGLDDSITEEMVNLMTRERVQEEMADLAREEALIERHAAKDREGSR